MDVDSSDFSAASKSLSWKTRLHQDYSPSRIRGGSGLRSGQLNLSNTDGAAAAYDPRKRGESRRTKRPEGRGSSGDILALMDEHFFYNASHGNGTGDLAAPNYEYMPNSEVETRFNRTLEWVGETRKVASPADSKRSARSPARKLNNPSSRDPTPPLHRPLASANANILSSSAAVSRDPRSSFSFRLPPPNSNNSAATVAVSRGDLLGSSFRHAKGDRFESSFGRSSNAASGDLRERSAAPRIRAATYNKSTPATPTRCMMPINDNHEPSATCKLPCQSCNTHAPKTLDAMVDRELHGYKPSDAVEPTLANYGEKPSNDRPNGRPMTHNNVPRPSNRPEMPAKPAAMTAFDAAKMQQRKPMMKIYPNEEIPQPVKSQRTQERAIIVKPSSTSSTGKVQNWFTKLIGIAPKEPKSLGKPPAKPPRSGKPEARKEGHPSDNRKPAAEVLAAGTTMHDVLNNTASNGTARAAFPTRPPKEAGKTAVPPLPRPNLPQFPNELPRSRSTPRSPNERQEPAAISRPGRRITAEDRRFGTGSKSERWAPLHLNQQPMQTRSSSGSRSAKSSPVKQPLEQRRQAKPEIDIAPTMMQTAGRRSARTSPVKQFEQRRQANITLEDDQRRISIGNRSARISPSKLLEQRRQAIMSEEDQRRMPIISSRSARTSPVKLDQQRRRSNIEDAQRMMNLSTRSERSSPVRQQRPARTLQVDDQGFANISQRLYVARQAAMQEELQRSAKTSPIHAAFATKPARKTEVAQNASEDDLANKKKHSSPSQDRDIEVLNDFLTQQRNNLRHGCTNPNCRLHLIVSNNSGISSMISAICYAWILQNTLRKADGWDRVPVMNIPRRSMWGHTQLAWLFEQAGLDTKAVLFNDEVDLESLALPSQYRISTIGLDILSLRGEVASYCTLVAEAFFKEIDPAKQAKCIRILLLAGLLVDTENLDSPNVYCTRRDEAAANSLLPGAGYKGRAVLLAELKQKHESQDFYDMMTQNYGKPLPSVASLFKESERNAIGVNDRDAVNFKSSTTQIEDKVPETFSINRHNEISPDEISPFSRTKSSKSNSSISTISAEAEKQKLSPSSPPPIDRTSMNRFASARRNFISIRRAHEL